MEMAAVIKKAKKIEWKEVDGETIILKKEKNKFFILNKTGTFIWKKINGKNTEKKISLALAKKYDIAEEKALADTKQITKKLFSFGLAKK